MELQTTTTHAPAILVEGHDEALVLDAGHGGVVPVLAGKDLLGEVALLPADVCVLGPVVPEEGHHHFAWKFKQNVNLKSW